MILHKLMERKSGSRYALVAKPKTPIFIVSSIVKSKSSSIPRLLTTPWQCKVSGIQTVTVMDVSDGVGPFLSSPATRKINYNPFKK
jgi:hypothetical protein